MKHLILVRTARTVLLKQYRPLYTFNYSLEALVKHVLIRLPVRDHSGNEICDSACQQSEYDLMDTERSDLVQVEEYECSDTADNGCDA